MPATYERSVVTFLDILGFSDLLNSKSPEEIMALFGRLERFTKPDPHVLSYGRTVSVPYFFTISDAVVRIRPVDTEFRDGAIVHEILDLFHAQVNLVNQGVLIRGGVALGQAHCGPEGEGPPFGPALVRAYNIEAKEAIYPRLVIDDELLEQHEGDVSLRSQTSSKREEKEILSRLLATGEDGMRYIDYLSIENIGEFDDPSEYLTFLQSHCDLVKAGLAKFSKGSVFRKYQWLKQYHNREIERQRATVMSTAEGRASFLEEYDIDPGDFYNEVQI